MHLLNQQPLLLLIAQSGNNWLFWTVSQQYLFFMFLRFSINRNNKFISKEVQIMFNLSQRLHWSFSLSKMNTNYCRDNLLWLHKCFDYLAIFMGLGVFGKFNLILRIKNSNKQNFNVRLIFRLKVKYMKNQFSDINQQIDRILSCNIRQELLSGLPVELLQSPVVQKKLPKYQVQSSNKRSEKMSQMEQDLYDKAEQVFKLKQLLQTELANINQIVADNQKLTEANEYLKQELKKVKNEWEQLKVSTVDKLQKEIQLLKEFQAEQIEKITQETNKNKNQRKNKMLVSSCDQIIEISVKMSCNQLFQQEKLQIHSHFVNLFIQPSKINTHSNMTSKYVQTSCTIETFETLESLQAEITNLNKTIQSLKTDKMLLNNKISTLQSIQTIKNSGYQKQPEVLAQKHLNHQQKSQQKSSIQCYSSIFMKSVFQQDENIEENIRKALYNSQQSIFQQLQESKYFGKIVMRAKNGNAIQQYKNMFQYEGKFFKNQRQGLGKLFYKNQLVYAGQWKNGKFEGKGTLYYYLNLNVQKIQANFEKGMIQGFGTIYFKSKSKIRAKFRNNIISSEERIIVQEEISLNLRHKSFNGKAQFNRDKENTRGKGRVFFQVESGKLITIN